MPSHPVACRLFHLLRILRLAAAPLAVLIASLSGPVFATPVGGDVLVNTTWDVAGSPFVVVDTVYVRNGAILTIQPGVEVRLDPNLSILAEDSAIIAVGTPDSTILFTRNQPQYWGTLAAFGSNSSMTFRHCVIEWGYQNLVYSPVELEGMVSHVFATTVIEDCVLRNAGNDGVEFEGGSIMFRRNLVTDVLRQGYNSFSQATGVVEDNRLESIGNDAFDITSPNGEEVIFRNNIAVDVGIVDPRGDGVDIDHTPVFFRFGYFEAYNVSDKGISVSVNSLSVLVENTIIVNAGNGSDENLFGAAYVVTNNSGMSVFNCVAYGSKRGFLAAQQNPPYAGANMTVVNSITWNSILDPVFVDPISKMTIINSILDTPEPYPGQGNLNTDPRFVAPLSNDFRLLSNSPAIDAGWSDATPEFDIRGNPRVDHPGVVDTGGPPPLTYWDIGAHEFDPNTTGAGLVPPLARFGLNAYPSPAPGQVHIGFELPDRREVEVTIYDPAGRVVERLFRGPLGAGRHDVPWFGSGHGRAAGGVYFIRLRAGSDEAIEKLVRVR